MSDIDIDQIIDAVAREMTAGDPPALTAAILPRLRPRRSLTWRVWVPVAGALAVAAVAVVIALNPSLRVVTPMISRAAPTTAVASATHPSAARESAPSEPSARAAHAIRAASEPAATPASTDFGLPALPALAPLDTATASPIQPEPLAITQLVVQPMKELAPLTIPALGDIDRQP
jgi:hypothetical protein